MTYVITQNCCNDASCVPACPVACIHPTPGEPGFSTAEMLYIDPGTCIDCGACADACPVDAIVPDTALTDVTAAYRDMNAAYYQHNPQRPDWQHRAPTPMVTTGREGLRVAIVGSGPSAFYAAKKLLDQPGVEVHMYERLPVPYGLVRHGVAPDHPATKSVTDQFGWTRDRERRFNLHLNIEIGAHLDHRDLLAHHHAVIYAYGAFAEVRLDIPGNELPGSVAAAEFVGWYNGHPDYADLAPDLTGRRAVVIGNGNVALDMARILVSDPDRLAGTDIAEHALDALRDSNIEEVVIVGRRGPAQAAFTTPELLALTQLSGTDVIVDPSDLAAATVSTDPITRQKLDLLATRSGATPSRGTKRIVLSFHTTPTEILGEERVRGVGVRCNELRDQQVIDTGLVLHSIGFRGAPIPDVPFDPVTCTIPNHQGRVRDPATADSLTGVYAAGWIKRGPSGVIGTNRSCSEETVAALIDDYLDNRLTAPAAGSADLDRLIRRRRPEAHGKRGWAAIDAAERAAGAAVGKPRRKFTRTGDMLAAAAPRPRRRWPLRIGAPR